MTVFYLTFCVLGNAAAGTGGGFGFGQALGTTPQSSGLLFGSVGQLATTTQAVNFNLQTGQTSNTALPLYGSQQANAIRPTGFSFQPPQTTQQSGFQLGSNTAGTCNCLVRNNCCNYQQQIIELL